MLSMPSFFLLTVSHYTLAQLPKASSAELCSVTQLCLTLWGPMDCSQPSSSARGIFQARILEWGAISYTRESFWSGDWTRVCWVSCRFFTTSTSWEAPICSSTGVKRVLLREFPLRVSFLKENKVLSGDLKTWDKPFLRQQMKKSLLEKREIEVLKRAKEKEYLLI